MPLDLIPDCQLQITGRCCFQIQIWDYVHRCFHQKRKNCCGVNYDFLIAKLANNFELRCWQWRSLSSVLDINHGRFNHFLRIPKISHHQISKKTGVFKPFNASFNFICDSLHDGVQSKWYYELQYGLRIHRAPLRFDFVKSLLHFITLELSIWKK